MTGGALKDERRTNPDNLTETAIDGGMSRRLAKGDWVMVPEKTPHWFTQVDGYSCSCRSTSPRDRLAIDKAMADLP